MTWMSLFFALSLGWAQSAPQSTPFDPFVKNFIWHSHGKFDAEYFRNVQIIFHEKIDEEIKHPRAIAVCYQTLYFPLKIQIDPVWWNSVDRNEHWSVVYHEIGHCACSLDHPIEAQSEWFFDFLSRRNIKVVHSPKLEDGCPKSLMYPEVVWSACIAKHRDYYIRELFGSCKKMVPAMDLGKSF